MVEGDEERLVQVFINLLENAVKYTPDHRPDLHGHPPCDAQPDGVTALDD
ncbi:MAG: hypothetical protein QM771_01785 [Nitrospira sp.]